ncbi:cobalt ECF transporter T component CbiQ [Tissierella carlieri]|uniref:Cobalt ECF transporter T component CbiQ n=1 Tax=Tissierella carlieri TaxID=689904 RepID=A0ABT1S8Q0_9FIRM|nr:cobalt ECF transporter T component CbiQ [Tissierella carlieri]MBU5312437.1 cobalt ECF transporter T component CbiQ [Tissierella carlieri]MCQ4922844.1 cobalt ECF transporter T component CbiQ [Tissierella carlieri]
MLLIDKYAYTNKLRNYPPQVKILLSCGGIVLSRLINSYYLDLLITILMIILVIGIAKVPFRTYFKMLLLPVSFLFISIITIMISVNGDFYLYYFKIMNICIGITMESMSKGIKLFTTVLSSLTSVYFLILTTPMIDIIRVLKKLKVPKLFIELMVLIYRSIFIFIEEANNIHLAQAMKFGYENKRNSLRSIALLIRNLFTRVFIRHNEMNISLECKLYSGEFKLGD